MFGFTSPLLAQAAMTKYHRLGLKQQTFIAQSSGGWKLKIRVAAWAGSSESCVPGLQMAAFSLCPHVVERQRERGKEGSLLFLIRAQSYLSRAPPLGPL